MKPGFSLFFFSAVFVLCLGGGAWIFFQWVNSTATSPDMADEAIQISSFAFSDGKLIPFRYTCEGENVNPPLNIMDAPEKTQSLVLIVDDPDASWGAWSHWLVWNVDPLVNQIGENDLPKGAVVGTNDYLENAYSGPCPPSGTHRYFFKVFALDTKLDLSPGTTREELMKAMKGHILDQGKLTGKYKK